MIRSASTARAWARAGNIMRGGSDGAIATARCGPRGHARQLRVVLRCAALRQLDEQWAGQRRRREEEAYTLLGGTATPSNGETVTRNPGPIFLTSENRVVQAAYHNAVGLRPITSTTRRARYPDDLRRRRDGEPRQLGRRRGRDHQGSYTGSSLRHVRQGGNVNGGTRRSSASRRASSWAAGSAAGRSTARPRASNSPRPPGTAATRRGRSTASGFASRWSPSPARACSSSPASSASRAGAGRAHNMRLRAFGRLPPDGRAGQLAYARVLEEFFKSARLNYARGFYASGVGRGP